VSQLAKRVLGPRFSWCRGVREDINHGIIDLANLLAVSICSSTFGEAKMRRLIDRNRSLGGWLIFYTPYCRRRPVTIRLHAGANEAVARYASKHTAILPVRNVLASLRPPRAISLDRVQGSDHAQNVRCPKASAGANFDGAEVKNPTQAGSPEVTIVSCQDRAAPRLVKICSTPENDRFPMLLYLFSKLENRKVRTMVLLKIMEKKTAIRPVR
jgi:hypothetical protein